MGGGGHSLQTPDLAATFLSKPNALKESPGVPF